MTSNAGPEPVFPGAPLTDGIAHGHYAEKVLRPITDAILEALGHSLVALDELRQLSLRWPVDGDSGLRLSQASVEVPINARVCYTRA